MTDHAARRLARFSRFIDNSYPETVKAEARMWRRTMKVVSEVGEVQDAVGGMLGENPRKGYTHNREDVVRELLDVAMAALGAVEYLHGNDGLSLDRLDEHIHNVADRMGVA